MKWTISKPYRTTILWIVRWSSSTGMMGTTMTVLCDLSTRSKIELIKRGLTMRLIFKILRSIWEISFKKLLILIGWIMKIANLKTMLKKLLRKSFWKEFNLKLRKKFFRLWLLWSKDSQQKRKSINQRSKITLTTWLEEKFLRTRRISLKSKLKTGT